MLFYLHSYITKNEFFSLVIFLKRALQDFFHNI